MAYDLMPQQHQTKLDDKVVKCIFARYSNKSRGYHLFHLQIKKILVSQDVVFVEDAFQPLLSCTRETHVRSQDMYDTLLPLFNGHIHMLSHLMLMLRQGISHYRSMISTLMMS